MVLSLLKRKYMVSLALMMVVMTVLAVLLFYTCVPQHYFVCFPFIPVFFFLFGWLNISALLFLFRNMPRYFISGFILCKGIKFIMSLLAVIVYGVMVHREIIAFTLVFLTFYVASLVLETRYFVRIESILKHRDTDNRTIKNND